MSELTKEQVELEERMVAVEERRAKLKRTEKHSWIRPFITVGAFLSITALIFLPMQAPSDPVLLDFNMKLYLGWGIVCIGIITWWFHKRDKERDPLLSGIIGKLGG